MDGLQPSENCQSLSLKRTGLSLYHDGFSFVGIHFLLKQMSHGGKVGLGRLSTTSVNILPHVDFE